MGWVLRRNSCELCELNEKKEKTKASDENRTHGLYFTKVALYQLSYKGIYDK